jgi:hypothetical protein
VSCQHVLLLGTLHMVCECILEILIYDVGYEAGMVFVDLIVRSCQMNIAFGVD